MIRLFVRFPLRLLVFLRCFLLLLVRLPGLACTFCDTHAYKVHDIYDLGMFAARPLDQPLLRRLDVLKLWQARDTFVPDRLIRKFEDGTEFDWDDLRELLRRSIVIDRNRITADCVRGFRFLGELTLEERTLANDAHQREQALRDRLVAAFARGL